MRSPRGRDRDVGGDDAPNDDALHDDALNDAALEDLLLGAARALRRSWSTGLADAAGIEMSRHDARALRVVGRHEPVRLGVIADHLRIAARSATDVVDRLEERGLVARAPDPADRRAMTASLTELGASVLARVDARRKEAAGDFFGALEPAERHTLAVLLAKLDAPSVGP